jgi:hypothetical protein
MCYAQVVTGPETGHFTRGTTITPLTANGEKWFAEAA